MAGACDGGNEQSGSIKCGEFLTSRATVSFSGGSMLRGVGAGQQDIENFVMRSFTVSRLHLILRGRSGQDG